MPRNPERPYNKPMAKSLRVSLANKCQLLFGAAVVLILTTALAVGFLRMQTLVSEGHENTARTLASEFLEGTIHVTGRLDPSDLEAPIHAEDEDTRLALIPREEFDLAGPDDPFLVDAIAYFDTRPDRNELFRTREAGVFRYLRAIRKSDLLRIRGETESGFSAGIDAFTIADPLEMVLVVELRSDLAAQQLILNRLYIIAAGLLAGLLAIAVFWFITTRIILSPVRVLRDYAAKVSQGNLNIRSDINTGDEYEQLSDMFNEMLDSIRGSQDQLKQANKSLDLKLGELAEHNVSLYEANKVKGEFLANVSHELRTPLNSIIGFAELLEETLADRTGPVDEKRKRYAGNIIMSSRQLLDLINDLLDLAKIEAGRIDLHIDPVSLADTCEALVNLIRPQAEKKQINLTITCETGLPMVETDPGKMQQILFNFLSNAVKFTPQGGEVTLRVEKEPDTVDVGNGQPRVRLSVTDTGPGIAAEDQDKIFDKFTQLDPSNTREHGGTGLGLTICRDLAKLLQGRIEVDSVLGEGATFTLVLPMQMRETSQPLMPDMGPVGI